MKLYVASKYQNKNFVRTVVVPSLQVAGFEVVSTWHRERYAEDVQVSDIRPARCRKLAKRDLKELDKADAFVVLSDGCKKSRGGMWVEMGYAVGKGIPVFEIGPGITIFSYLPQVKVYKTLKKFIEKHGPVV